MIETLASVFVLAILVEGIIQYFVTNENKKQPWLKYVAAVLGVVICIAYKADILLSLGLVSAFPFVGEVATGLIIGRGSNYLNDFISKVRKPSVIVTPEITLANQDDIE